MPSYAQEVKNELAHNFSDDKDCLLAEFVALLKVGARKIDGRLEFKSSNAAVVRRVITLGKKFFPLVKPEVAAVRRKKLLKNLIYVVRFIAAGEIQNFFDALDMSELLKRSRFKVAYLRGAFLACGSVNRPEAQYLLQIVTFTEAEAKFILKQLEKLEFNGGVSQRKKKFVVWLREGDTICDFLGMVGAEQAVERFEIARNLKEVRVQVNRIVNVETAMLNKSINAAQRQLADIKILLDKKAPVNKKLQEAMTVRLENPSCTMKELAEKIPMSMSGLLYRFKIIRRLAKKFSKK
ncbi:MAG: DNA-binding protein WhiA [Selenomonadaceae bacterium]|nr:DNA-binding protein WhiA [Selenomonadaceae bacterium]MBQ4404604.1 DNA-binding protein WhiA [Selenomonadaceae bacterium]MBQ6131820.1 DNA-binding protein WhiA [Selenomonadaceae bacterium]MBQ7493931.1 DNA-binding protein WhiA [Selenomonadaceae bacterium]